MAMRYIGAFLTIVLMTYAAGADVKLSGLFADNMVLQRDIAVPIWGWAEPGREVTVEFAGQRKTVIAGPDGKWMVRLDPMPASADPRILAISTSGGAVQDPARQIQNVLVGDVCAKQGHHAAGRHTYDVRLAGLLVGIQQLSFDATAVAQHEYGSLCGRSPGAESCYQHDSRDSRL